MTFISHSTNRRRLSNRRLAAARRGATTVESAFALLAMFVLLFGLFDIGLAVLRHNMLSVAAHAIARAAVVRGSTTSASMTQWGPQTYSGHMGNGSTISQAASDYLSTMPLSQVSVNVSWPDGGNDTGNRVTVTLGFQHEPITPLMSQLGTFSLQGQATLRIQE